MSQTNSLLPALPEATATDRSISMPGSPFGIAAGFVYGYQGMPAYSFMPDVRKLGADFTKIYFFWNQVEPEKGKYDWSAVDKFVGQLKSPDEGLIGIFSSSQWATKRPSTMLPPSPANNLEDYYRFVFDLVRHCRGKVRFWQNDAEPNNPVFWSGSKEEFVAQLKVFHKAVKDADPSAIVVVGGHDGLFGPPGTHQFPNQQAGLDFFDCIFKEGRKDFDIFDLRLYGDPYTIAARVQFMRQKMLAVGYDKSIISTEYGGPNLFEFPENRKYIPIVASWSQAVVNTDDKSAAPANASTKNPLEELHKNMAGLAPQTQMFMQGCAPELEAKYQRIQSRGIVMRNIFAFSAGVQKTIYWYLPRIPIDGEGRYNVMALMYGKIGLLDFQGEEVKGRYPTADAFERMTTALRGVLRVKRIEVAGKPSIFLFQVDREKRGPLYVLWEQRDAFSGEDFPAVAFDFPWTGKTATAVDALGQVVQTKLKDKQLHIEVSLTPIFIEGPKKNER